MVYIPGRQAGRQHGNSLRFSLVSCHSIRITSIVQGQRGLIESLTNFSFTMPMSINNKTTVKIKKIIEENFHSLIFTSSVTVSAVAHVEI